MSNYYPFFASDIAEFVHFIILFVYSFQTEYSFKYSSKYSNSKDRHVSKA